MNKWWSKKFTKRKIVQNEKRKEIEINNSSNEDKAYDVVELGQENDEKFLKASSNLTL